MDKNMITKSIKNLKESVQSTLKNISTKDIEKDSNEGTYPVLNLIESAETLNFIIELPGVKKENIKISLLTDALNIEVKKDPLFLEDSETYIIKESKYGSFVRKIDLPCKIEEDIINTKFENGILQLILHKAKIEKKEINID